VVNLLWLVIEDANKTNPLVGHTLDRIGVPYEYMVGEYWFPAHIAAQPLCHARDTFK